MNTIVENRQKKTYNIREKIDQLEADKYAYKSLSKGNNTPVIRPETRVNKKEEAEETLEQLNNAGCPLKEPLKKGQQPICENCETPNQNLMIIEEIEGLLSEANDKIYELPIHPIRSKAIEEIDLLRKVTIKLDLRKAFE